MTYHELFKLKNVNVDGTKTIYLLMILVISLAASFLFIVDAIEALEIFLQLKVINNV